MVWRHQGPKSRAVRTGGLLPCVIQVTRAMLDVEGKDVAIVEILSSPGLTMPFWENQALHCIAKISKKSHLINNKTHAHVAYT